MRTRIPTSSSLLLALALSAAAAAPKRKPAPPPRLAPVIEYALAEGAHDALQRAHAKGLGIPGEPSCRRISLPASLAGDGRLHVFQVLYDQRVEEIVPTEAILSSTIRLPGQPARYEAVLLRVRPNGELVKAARANWQEGGAVSVVPFPVDSDRAKTALERETRLYTDWLAKRAQAR